MTIVATTEDLRAWRHPKHKFAVLDETGFYALGSWDEVESASHHAVKELLTVPVETTI